LVKSTSLVCNFSQTIKIINICMAVKIPGPSFPCTPLSFPTPNFPSHPSQDPNPACWQQPPSALCCFQPGFSHLNSIPGPLSGPLPSLATLCPPSPLQPNLLHLVPLLASGLTGSALLASFVFCPWATPAVLSQSQLAPTTPPPTSPSHLPASCLPCHCCPQLPPMPVSSPSPTPPIRNSSLWVPDHSPFPLAPLLSLLSPGSQFPLLSYFHSQNIFKP